MSKIDICAIIKLRHLSDTVGGVTLICCWVTGNGYLKGHNFVSGVGLPSASSCKDPKYVLNELDPKGSFFFDFKKKKAFFLKELLSYLLYNLLYIYFGGVGKPVLSRVCEEISEKKVRDT